MRFRKLNPADIPQLKTLWKQGFGDSDEEIDRFFTTVWPNAGGFCAEENGAVISMVFSLPVALALADETKKAVYLYAVTTQEKYRRQGVCKKLLSYAEKELKKKNVACMLLVPEDDHLAAYYESLGFTQTPSVQLMDMQEQKPVGSALEISAQAYAGLRETILFDMPHVQYDKVLLSYEAGHYKFYQLQIANSFGCAAVCAKDGGCVVDELLPDAAFLPALATVISTDRWYVKCPGQTHVFAMMKWLEEEDPVYSSAYLAFSFD